MQSCRDPQPKTRGEVTGTAEPHARHRPQKGNDAADPDVVLEDVRDGHA